MRRHAQIRLDALQQADHGTGVQPVQRQTPPRVMPRLVRAFIKHAHQLRCAAHHRNISLVVNALEKSADILQGVDVLDGAVAAHQKSFFKRLGRANVSGSGCCRQQQYARL